MIFLYDFFWYVQDPSGEKFSSEAICEADHANQSVPLNPRKPMEKLKQPFKGFSNDSRNVHSGGKDDITGPESSSSNEFCSKPTEKISQGFSNDYKNVNLGAHDDNMAPSNSTMTTPDQVKAGKSSIIFVLCVTSLLTMITEYSATLKLGYHTSNI